MLKITNYIYINTYILYYLYRNIKFIKYFLYILSLKF